MQLNSPYNAKGFSVYNVLDIWRTKPGPRTYRATVPGSNLGSRAKNFVFIESNRSEGRLTVKKIP